MIIDTTQMFKIKPCLFYSQTYDSNFYMTLHAHDTLEIMYVTKGIMNFITLNEKNEEISNPVYQGEFILIKSNTPHKISFSDSKTHVLNLEFESLDSNKNINELFISNSYSNQYVKGKKKFKEATGPIILEDNGDVFQTINRLHKLLSSDMSIEIFETQYSLLMGQFISDILNCAEEKSNQGNYYIKKAMDFIKKNYKQSISVDDIANICGCSKTYIEKLFINEFQMSIAKKINEVRIEKAKIYLRNLPISPEEVAYSVGFSSYQSFINNFKELTGQKPASFSKNLNQQYQVIHAYKKSFFDVTYNKIFSLITGIGLMNSTIDAMIHTQNINIIFLESIDLLTPMVISKIKEQQKYFFYNITEVKKDLRKIEKTHKQIISLDLFDLFLGFYIPNHIDTENLYGVIDEIHQIIPYSRIIMDLEGYEISYKKKLVNETYITDVIDVEEDLSIHYHKSINKWIKNKINSISQIQDSINQIHENYEGILFSIQQKDYN